MTHILVLVFALLASSALQAKDDVVPLEYLNTLVSESTTYDPPSGIACFPVEAMFEEPELFDVCLEHIPSEGIFQLKNATHLAQSVTNIAVFNTNNDNILLLPRVRINGNGVYVNVRLKFDPDHNQFFLLGVEKFLTPETESNEFNNPATETLKATLSSVEQSVATGIQDFSTSQTITDYAKANNLDRNVKATKTGTVTCPSKYSVGNGLGESFLHIFNNTCYSCPENYNRTIDPNVEGSGACADTNIYAAATIHNRATGLIGTDCPSGQFWNIGDGFCYSCPASYNRTVFAVDSPQACERSPLYTAATKRGAPGCQEGSFQHFLSNSCYSCPENYNRSTSINLAGDLENDPNACELNTEGLFLASHLEEAQRLLQENAELINKAIEILNNFKQLGYQNEIKNAYNANRPLQNHVMQDTGMSELRGSNNIWPWLRSFSISLGADASYYRGANGSVGINIDQTDGPGTPPSKPFLTVGLSLGPSIGLDGELGFSYWGVDYDKIGGPSHGVALQATAGVGGSVVFWWNPDDGSFLGFTVSVEGGGSVGAEYDLAYTFQ